MGGQSPAVGGDGAQTERDPALPPPTPPFSITPCAQRILPARCFRLLSLRGPIYYPSMKTR